MEKIQLQKEIYSHRKDNEMTWGDIKHLELEDDDVIRATWVEDEKFEYHGYWHGSITRMVEETDGQYEKRREKLEIQKAVYKKNRYENYLKLKEEFGNE